MEGHSNLVCGVNIRLPRICRFVGTGQLVLILMSSPDLTNPQQVLVAKIRQIIAPSTNAETHLSFNLPSRVTR